METVKELFRQARNAKLEAARFSRLADNKDKEATALLKKAASVVALNIHGLKENSIVEYDGEMVLCTRFSVDSPFDTLPLIYGNVINTKTGKATGRSVCFVEDFVKA